jgi:hypothetical protein
VTSTTQRGWARYRAQDYRAANALLLLGRLDEARREYRAVAGETHPVKRRTGDELVRADWCLLRAAGIDVPEL